MRGPAVLLLVLALPAVRAAAAQNWQPVACPEPSSTADMRNRVGAMLDAMSATPAEWKPTLGEQNCRATTRAEQVGGKTMLRVDFDFSGKAGLEYVDLQKPLALPDGAQGICISAERSVPELIPAVRIADASGEIHQFWGQEDTNRGRHRIYFPFKSGQGWGGDGNGRLDAPLRIAALIFDRPSAGWKGRGYVRLCDLALSEVVQSANDIRIEVEGSRFGNVYRPGETIRVRAYAQGELLGYRILDHRGNGLGSSRGLHERPVVEHVASRLGWFAVRFDSLGKDGARSAREYRFAVVPEPAKPGNPFVGFCTHYGQNAYPLPTMDLMKRYGFTRFRDEISWGAVEPERGKRTLPDYAARYLNYAKRVGLQPLIIFDYANAHYDNGGFPNSADAIAGFAAYCAFLADATRETVRDFEIWNEWTGGCGMVGRPGDHGPEAYGRLLRPSADATRRVRADATICGVGGEYGPDCADTVARMFRSGATPAVDAFSIHPYRYPAPPESSDLAGDMRRIRDASVRAGAPKRMWVTEIGYPTHVGRAGVAEAEQARLCVRTAAILQTCGAVDRLYWYDLKDDGHEPTYNEHNFGVIRHQDLNCAPKPAVVALSVFARMTAGAVPVGLTTKGGLWIARWRRGAEQIVAVWTPDGTRRIAVTGKRVTGFDMMGNVLAGKPSEATAEPVWVAGRGAKVLGR